MQWNTVSAVKRFLEPTLFKILSLSSKWRYNSMVTKWLSILLFKRFKNPSIELLQQCLDARSIYTTGTNKIRMQQTKLPFMIWLLVIKKLLRSYYFSLVLFRELKIKWTNSLEVSLNLSGCARNLFKNQSRNSQKLDQLFKIMKINLRNFHQLRKKLKKLFPIIKLEQWNLWHTTFAYLCQHGQKIGKINILKIFINELVIFLTISLSRQRCFKLSYQSQWKTLIHLDM